MPTSSPTADALSLDAFQHVVAAFERADVRLRNMLRISANERLVLTYLMDSAPATAAQLSRWIGVTTAAMAGIIARLEKDGLIVRKRDPRDARRHLLYPSRLLVSRVDEFMEPLVYRFEAEMSRLSEDERRGAIRLLKTLAALYERESVD